MFQFQIAQPAGLGFADGFTFIIQDAPEGITALGSTGGFLGYTGIANSVVVEFDTFDNGPTFGDPGAPHVAVHTNGPGVNTASNSTLVGDAVIFPGLVDGHIHTAFLDYVPGTLSLFIDDLSSPLLSISLNLDTTLALDNGRAIVGFTSGTAAGAANHDILTGRCPPFLYPSRRVSSYSGWDCPGSYSITADVEVPSGGQRAPRNEDKLVWQIAPLKLEDIWAVQERLQIPARVRDVALFRLAIESKLRARDLVKFRVRDLSNGGCAGAHDYHAAEDSPGRTTRDREVTSDSGPQVA